jgi:hypothetical protein
MTATSSFPAVRRSVQRITVAGRQAMRVESEATGEGLADRGMRSLRYVIDLGGGRSLIASTHDAASRV